MVEHGGRTRGSGQKFKRGSNWIQEKNFFPKRTVGQWNRLLNKAVLSLSLKDFKTWLD